MDAELARLDAVGLAEAIRTGQLSPAEALESSIRRMEAVDGDINAVIHRHLDEARASIDSLPDGPFRGVPMLMKDLWACEAGRPHHQGVQALKITEPSPTETPISSRPTGRQASSPSDERIRPSSAPAPPPSRSPTGRPATRGICTRAGWLVGRRSRCGRCRRAAGGQRKRRRRFDPYPRSDVWPGRPQAEPRPHLDGPAHGRVGQLGPARRVSHGADSAAILDATIVHVPGDGVIAPRRTNPTPTSSAGIPAGSVSASSITPSARTPRSTPTSPTQFVRPPPDSRRSATMSSPACPLPYSTNPASRRGVPPSPPAPRIRGGDRRRGRPRARRRRHRTLDHVHRRAGLDVPTGGRDRRPKGDDNVPARYGDMVGRRLRPVAHTHLSASGTDARRDGPRQRRPDGRAGHDLALFAADSALQRHRSAGDLVAARPQP